MLRHIISVTGGLLLIGGSISMAQTMPATQPAKLPDLFVTQNGKLITSPDDWRNIRRPELLELFRKYVYGRNAVDRPKNLTFEHTGTLPIAMDGAATRKLVDIHFSGPHGKGTIHLTLFIPNRRTEAAPVFLLICNRGRKNIDPDRVTRSDFWPAELLVSRGYAAAAIHVSDMDPDQDDGFKNGVHGVFDDYPDGKRPADAWATIGAWAWGCSRAMDYFETDKDLDAKRVALVGHSRGGKTALWCGAQDERFAMIVSNESGSTGASLARNKMGETIRKINDQFPHWFCENYKAFNDRENDLPVDQHQLIALMAPRLVYVGSAIGDQWSDPGNEFRACVSASPVWKLFGVAGFNSDRMEPDFTPVTGGRVGYHMRQGEHDLKLEDWNHFIEFFTQNMKSAGTMPNG